MEQSQQAQQDASIRLSRGKRPKKILLRLITIDRSQLDSGRIVIQYANNSPPFDNPKDSIEEYVKWKSTANNGLYGTNNSAFDLPERVGTNRPSPLDLELEEDLYIVFALDPRWQWQFNPDGTCFTLHRPDSSAKDRYRHVRHVINDGNTIKIVKNYKHIGDGCMMLYLRGYLADENANDKFNLHTELFADDGAGPTRLSTKIIIDPDVKNCPTCGVQG